MTKTEHYQLNQWDAADPVRREDFNGDNAKIDAALRGLEQAKADADTVAALEANVAADLAAMAADLGGGGKNCRVAAGSYVGTGAYGEKNPISLTFDFCPAAVIVADPAGEGNTIMVRSNPYAASIEGYNMKLTWGERSVSWCYNGSSGAQENNISGVTYHYVVLGYTDGQ